MPGDPFKAPFRSSGRKPKASRPRTPKISNTAGNRQMPGVTGPKATVSSAIRTPKVRVTSKARNTKRMPAVPRVPSSQKPGVTG